MTKYITHWTTAFITAILMIMFHYSNNMVVETARLKSFDLLQQLDTPQLSTDIGIIEIDEASIEKYGQWPWDRNTIGNLIYDMRQAGVGIIVLPIVFSEVDRLGGDEYLDDALWQNGVVIAQTGSIGANKNAVPRGVAMIGDPLPWLYEWPGMLGPLPRFGKSADGVGVLNTTPEIDGVVRRVPLIVRIGDETYPNIAVEVIRVATGAPSYQIKSNEGGVEKVRIPGYPIINTDPNASIWLRWNKEFPSISASRPNDFIAFEGKTVVLGVTADGIGGLIASPKGAVYNYVPAATTLQTLLDGEQIERPFWAYLSELSATILLTLGVVVLARFAPYWLVGAKIVSWLAILAGLSYYAWTYHLYLVDTLIPAVALVIVGFHAVFNRFVREFQEKQKIKKQFEHYLAPAMVRKLQKNPELLKLGGDTRELTIMFTDIRGFTPISEQYKTDPQGLTKLINRYMTPMTNIVMENDGTVDKYIGDALMAFWNAPLDVPEQKQLAAKVAMEMQHKLNLLNKELEDEGLLPIKIGIGINTGDVVVGNMGSDQRFDYSVLGDAVNLSARLEGQSKSYGLTLLVGEASVCEGYPFIELDSIAVKGKKEPVKIFTILNKSPSNTYMTKHNRFLELYRKGLFEESKKAMRGLSSEHDQLAVYYKVMLERIEDMIVNPPENWNGVFVATTK